jgi:NitT/TauT family transport system ATP-binding protein
MSATPDKVVFQNVSKSFDTKGDDLLVLEDVNLTIAEGEFVCLLGPSGCGKSTLLNIAGGFEPPTRGTVSVDGEPVLRPHPRRVFVFQEYGIFPWASVWDNIVLGIRHLSRQEQHDIAQGVIDLVGLSGFERAYPMELSGGMKQRVEVARALAVSPDVIYMDEPFGALDSLTRLAMRSELIRIWKDRHPTILFVTHDVDEAIQLAERVVVFSARPGRIEEIIDVNLPHPRDLSAPEYGQVKNRLYERLGVSHRI